MHSRSCLADALAGSATELHSEAGSRARPLMQVADALGSYSDRRPFELRTPPPRPRSSLAVMSVPRQCTSLAPDGLVIRCRTPYLCRGRCARAITAGAGPSEVVLVCMATGAGAVPGGQVQDSLEPGASRQACATIPTSAHERATSSTRRHVADQDVGARGTRRPARELPTRAPGTSLSPAAAR